MRPRRRAPGSNASVKTAPNHWPNSRESVSARQTLVRGWRSRTCLSMRSAVLVLMASPRLAGCQFATVRLQISRRPWRHATEKLPIRPVRPDTPGHPLPPALWSRQRTASAARPEQHRAHTLLPAVRERQAPGAESDLARAREGPGEARLRLLRRRGAGHPCAGRGADGDVAGQVAGLDRGGVLVAAGPAGEPSGPEGECHTRRRRRGLVEVPLFERPLPRA